MERKKTSVSDTLKSNFIKNLEKESEIADIRNDIDDVIFDWVRLNMKSNEDYPGDWHCRKLCTLKTLRDMFTELINVPQQ